MASTRRPLTTVPATLLPLAEALAAGRTSQCKASREVDVHVDGALPGLADRNETDERGYRLARYLGRGKIH
jgi:hypothetical protein